jgi:FtsH-binding integral membrane protein
VELKDSPDFTSQVFQFLSLTIACIGLLSLLLLVTAPSNQRGTILWFAGLTISISVALRFVRLSARTKADLAAKAQSSLPISAANP